jgi:hypothetical protein
MLLLFFRPHVYGPPAPVTEVAQSFRLYGGVSASIRV